MRALSRVLSAMMLIFVLFSFCMWRYEKLSLLSGAVDYVNNALHRVEDLVALTKPVGDGDGGDDDQSTAPSDPNSSFGDHQPSAPVDATLRQALYDGLIARQATIDLSGLSPSKADVSATMAAIIYSSPELFYLQSGYSLSTTEGGVQSVSPTYTCTDSELIEQRAAYEAALDEIVAGAPVTGSDFDKLLYLHDYFIENYTYDYTYTIRDAYTFFIEKTGVCQAYMLGLIAAARELGIESKPVTSDVMTHAWNLVLLDGSWYHVDLTWDDSSSLPTATSYTYFLQSDAGLVAIDSARKEADRHRAWSAEEQAANNKYDAAPFRSAVTPMIKQGNTYYCTAKAPDGAGNTVRGVVLWGTDVLDMTAMVEIKGGYWTAGGNSFYASCYADLAVIGDDLYYHSGNSVCRVPLSGGTPQTVKLLSLTGTNCIYGFMGVVDGALQLLVAPAPNAQPAQCTVYAYTPEG
ncbi:MAG: hypothetical protein E7639_02535 [Ruminococcaceae bacterium]|nr:hypothetical protein [Oscillospiraceae bacterium]